MGTGRRCEAFI